MQEKCSNIEGGFSKVTGAIAGLVRGVVEPADIFRVNTDDGPTPILPQNMTPEAAERFLLDAGELDKFGQCWDTLDQSD